MREKIGSLREGVKPVADDFEKREKALKEILPEVFAMVRELAVRTIGQRHFDVQLIGGMVLHGGRINEMKTGEGKTLVATLALTLNALAQRGAHLVTVNDYLAKRDAEWMGSDLRIFRFTCRLPAERSGRRRAGESLSGRYHARHELGVRIRLSPRQHGHGQVVSRAETALLRDCR